MLVYLIQRLLLALVTLWIVTLLSFAIVQIPPNQAARALPGRHLPVQVQYVNWLLSVSQGNFGTSNLWGKPATVVIRERMVLTVVLGLAALAITWIVALPVGVFSAMRPHSPFDVVGRVFGFVGMGMPNFLAALALMYFAWNLFGLSPGGLFSPDFRDAPWSLNRVLDLLVHLPMPAMVLGLGGTAALIRLMRANLLDEMNKPYVLAARAKGLSETHRTLKYPVRVALNPFISSLGFIFPDIISGTVAVSMVLSLPTLGPVLMASIYAQDMYLVGTIILLLSALTVVGTALSDILLQWIDPRIRVANEAG